MIPLYHFIMKLLKNDMYCYIAVARYLQYSKKISLQNNNPIFATVYLYNSRSYLSFL